MTQNNVNPEELFNRISEDIDTFVELGYNSKDEIFRFLRSRIPSKTDINLEPFPPGQDLVQTGKLKSSYGLTEVQKPSKGAWEYIIGNTAPYAAEVLKKSNIPYIGISMPLVEILENEFRKNLSFFS